MRYFGKTILVSMMLVSIFFVFSTLPPAYAGEEMQQPTVAIATVTGTPEGPTVRVNADQDQINVRSGPGTDYEQVGILVTGQIVPAYGVSAAGLWIQIGYPGIAGERAWVYSPLVTVLNSGDLPVVEPPPTPTPRVTPTIDPTLAAQFVEEIPATRLPTFTAPPPLIIPTFTNSEPALSSNTFPMGLVISILGVIGIMGFALALIRRR